MPGRDAIGSTSILSADDLPAVLDPDLPHELWHGVLRVVMPASGAHGAAVSRLTVMLGQHVYAHDLGELFSESTGFLLERGPDTLLCPDVAFVAKGRLAAGGSWLLTPSSLPPSRSSFGSRSPMEACLAWYHSGRVPAPGDSCPDKSLAIDPSSACRA